MSQDAVAIVSDGASSPAPPYVSSKTNIQGNNNNPMRSKWQHKSPPCLTLPVFLHSDDCYTADFPAAPARGFHSTSAAVGSGARHRSWGLVEVVGRRSNLVAFLLVVHRIGCAAVGRTCSDRRSSGVVVSRRVRRRGGLVVGRRAVGRCICRTSWWWNLDGPSEFAD